LSENPIIIIGGVIFLILFIVVIINKFRKDLRGLPSKMERKGYDNSTSHKFVERNKRRGWTETEKEQVRTRQGGMCKKCGKPPPRWDYHHKNGNSSDNSLSNCEGLCPNCHSLKTNE